jgi:hypothetical protein
MFRRLTGFLGAVLATPCVYAGDSIASVVLGHGVSNSFLAAISCEPNSLCMDDLYVWVLDANRTLVGPRVSGRVRAVMAQHITATAQFVRSVELFVLSPLPANQRLLGVTYSIISLSARDDQGRYCISVKPTEVGLKLEPAAVTVDASSGYYCFYAAALASNNRSRVP